MHFHLPKPLHGWREFAGEVGIIVIGVLIALGAEQMVAAINAHEQVDQYRRAANRELAFNLAAFDYRMAQSSCVERRIAELNRWRVQWQTGSGKALVNDIARPSIISMRSSVRDSAPADVLTRIPIDERTKIAALYDTLGNNDQQTRDERDAWRSLAAFNHATALTHEDLMRLDEQIYKVASLDRVLRVNDRQLHREAKQLGVRPDFGPDRADLPAADTNFCRSILAS